MPIGKDARLLKRFLEELERSLDLKKTILKLGIQEEDAKVLLESVLTRLFPRIGTLIIYVDGASRGNPGKSGAGAVIKTEAGKTLKRLKKPLGVTTNNVAEYMALIMALEEAKALGGEDVRVFADSELLVKQINGEYRVKSEGLKNLYSHAVTLKQGFSGFGITHIPREKNKEADILANSAIDSV